MSQQWFFTRDGKERFGPYSAKALSDLASSRQLVPTDMVLKDGTAQWVLAGSVKGLFPAAARKRKTGEQPTSASAIRFVCPTCKAVMEAPLTHGGKKIHCRSCGQRLQIPPPQHAQTVLAIGIPESGGQPALGSDVMHSVPPTCPDPTNPVPTHAQEVQPRKRILRVPYMFTIVAASAAIVGLLLVISFLFRPSGSPSGNLGSAITVEDSIRKTKFLVTLKDVCWTDYDRFSRSEKRAKRLLVIYSYKNLGPREGSLYCNAEIKTAKGNFFSAKDSIDAAMEREFNREVNRRDIGGWFPVRSSKIQETGEHGLLFEIPADEIPNALKGHDDDKDDPSKKLAFTLTLPHAPYPFRGFNSTFGLMPHPPDAAIPALIDALSATIVDRDPIPIGKGQALEPKFQELDVRTCLAAIEALGTIGPAAKDALPALKKIGDIHREKKISVSISRDYVYVQILNACSAAIAKISSKSGD